MEWYHYLLAIAGGAFAGALNTLAGNGSAITLSILTLLFGLEDTKANGTNRVGILFQGIISTVIFYKHDRINFKGSALYTIPCIIGAVIGGLVVVNVSNQDFRKVFTALMFVMFFVVLIKPDRWLRKTEENFGLPPWAAIPIFLCLGFYGGFIQMGMGIFFLAAMVLGARYSLIDANAVKLFVVTVYTVGLLAFFAYKGLVDWRIGGIMAIGQGLGGWATTHFAANHPKANVWAHRVLIVVVIVVLVKLIIDFGLFS